MLLFTTLILLSIHAASNADPPHNHYQNFNQIRGMQIGRQWSPFKSASPDNLNFQEAANAAPTKSPEVPPVPPRTPQYSSPWLPIRSAIDQTSQSYRSEDPRFPDYHASPPLRRTPPSVQHSVPPFQHNQAPVRHTQAPVQHTQATVQHTPSLSQYTFPVEHPIQSPNRYPNLAPYDRNGLLHHQVGRPELETPHHQSPGFNQYQSDKNVQYWPSSYDVPLYAPSYEPGPNEDHTRVIDWATFADAFGHQQSAPQTQKPPNHRYKIVFIKTPRIPGFYPPTTPSPPQDQEKTLIYVLVNRPDYDPATTPAPPPSTTPSKPEVYFIQYKTKSNQSQI